MALYFRQTKQQCPAQLHKGNDILIVSLCTTCIYVSLAEFEFDILYWKYIYRKHRCSTHETNYIDAAIN